MSGDGRDPKNLEGRPDEESNSFRPREFFWDSVTLYVVSVIIALAAIDALTEFIRGSNVSCLTFGETKLTDQQNEYIREFCSGNIPNTEYFPAFIVVHAILIAIPHYLWLNHYGGNFDFFFVQASLLDRLRDEKSGEYSDKNRLILQQLTTAFSTYKKNWMFILYVGKLFLQLVFTLAGFVAAIVTFTDFEGTFYCPCNNFDPNGMNYDQNCTTSDFWPLNEGVRCVFTSLQLFGTIRVVDLILLAVLILSFAWSLIWCFSSHASALGTQKVAEFSFQTGILPEYYIPPTKLSLNSVHKRIRSYIYTVLASVPIPFTRPRISTNLDFMVMKLYRTDSGLGHVFRELQILQRIKEFNDDEHGMIELHHTQQRSRVMADKSLVDSSELKAELRWKINKNWGEYGIFSDEYAYQAYPFDKALLLPDSMRGVVMGFGARAPINKVALYVTFGSPSMGIATALSRVFDIVGVVNFNPYYRVYDPDSAILGKKYASNIYEITCPVDVLSSDIEVSNAFVTGLDRVLWTGMTAEAKKVDYIVIGPVHKKVQMTTVSLFIDQLSIGNLRKDGILLSMQPTAIAGKDIKTFTNYVPPPKYYQAKQQKISLQSEAEYPSLPWPPEEPQGLEPPNTQDASSFSLPVHCGDCISDIEFSLFWRVKQQPPKASP